MTDTTNTDDGIQVNEMIADGKATEAARALILMQLARDARDEARAQRDACRASLSEMKVDADAMLEALEECASDLEAEVTATYPEWVRKYASGESRYQNDMAPVFRARAIIARVKGERA